MSRIGSNPIKLNNNVKVEIKENEGVYGGQQVKVSGPKGDLKEDIRPEIKVIKKDDELIFKVAKKLKGKYANQINAYHGLYRSLVYNMVEGVEKGYMKKLEIRGIGYKAEKKGGKIVLHIGFTHPIEYEIPEGIDIDIKENVNITIKGASKFLVGETAAQIRSFRKPEPYKGKGIRYRDEYVRRKVGKAAA